MPVFAGCSPTKLKERIEKCTEYMSSRTVSTAFTVGTHNAAAERLYRSLGFTEYGIEPAGLRVGGRDIHDRLMTLDLTAPG